VPAAIAEVIDRALAFERDDRWSGAQAMKDALSTARSDSASEPADDDEPEEHTKVTPPSRNTGPEVVTQPIDIDLVGHVASDVTHMAASREARVARSRRDRIAMAIGGGTALIVALLFILLSGHPQPAAMAVAPSSPTPSIGSSPEPPAPVTPQPLLAPAGSPEVARSMVAPTPQPTHGPEPTLSTPKPAPAPPRAHASTAPQAPVAVTAGPSSPTAKHDPLSPW
jgi:hypothetical protein